MTEIGRSQMGRHGYLCSAHSLLVQGPHLRRITVVCVVHTDTLFMVVIIIAGVLVVLYRTPPITDLLIQIRQLFIDAPWKE